MESHFENISYLQLFISLGILKKIVDTDNVLHRKGSGEICIAEKSCRAAYPVLSHMLSTVAYSLTCVHTKDEITLLWYISS